MKGENFLDDFPDRNRTLPSHFPRVRPQVPIAPVVQLVAIMMTCCLEGGGMLSAYALFLARVFAEVLVLV